MALPPFDFLTSAPIDQLGTSLGKDFDYLGAYRSGQGIRNDIDYSNQPMIQVMPPPFTIGDNPDVISDMSLADYMNFQKYMRERGAADLINTQNQIPIKDDGSDSKGIGEIILPPIAGGGGGGGGVTPEFLKTYTTGDNTTGDNTTGATTVNMSSNPAAYLTGKGRLDPMGSGFYDTLNMIEAKDPSSYKMSTFNKDFAPSAESGQISYDPKINPNIKKAFYESVYQEPQKQNFLQKGIGSIKNFFTDSKFFQPKIQGELGTRLANQYKTGQKLPSFVAAIAQAQSPFNPKSKNYNPLLENQLNIAEANDKVGRDPNSGILKYNTNSVLSGQNVISGFGTNDYEKQLENYLDKVQGVFDKKYGDVDITEYEDFSLKDLKALDPKNAFDAKKIAAATYKTKYINAAITELDPFKNKTYIEKKKEIEQQKIKDAAEKELQEKMTNIGNVTAAQQAQANKDYQRVQRAYREDTGPGPGSYAPGGGSGEQSDGSYNDPFDPGGGEKDGGHIDGTNRRRFGEGGIVTL